jgi:hypothetical protein
MMKSDLCKEMQIDAPESAIMLEQRVVLERQYGYSIDEINAAWRGTVTLPLLSVGFEIIL